MFINGADLQKDRNTADQSDTKSRKGIFSIGYIKDTIYSNYTKLSVFRRFSLKSASELEAKTLTVT